MHASPPVDLQQTDTYFVVAHFHYVLFGGSIFGLFAGVYYWWPKITGRMLDERLGKVHFWLMLLGFNLTFFPKHYLGAHRHAAPDLHLRAGLGWDFWNLVSTIGAFLIALSILVFIINVVKTQRRPGSAGPILGTAARWSGHPSPPPTCNFSRIPIVHGRDELWLQSRRRRRGAGFLPATPTRRSRPSTCHRRPTGPSCSPGA